MATAQSLRQSRTAALLGRIWAWAVIPLSSLGTTVLSLALAIGTYDVEEFLGYFTHPVILLLNWLPVLLLQTLLYSVCGRHWLAFLLTAAPVLLASAGDFYKIKFRFEPFTFQDMDSVAAGLEVAGDYPLTLNSRILAALLYTLLGTPLLALLAKGRARPRRRLLGGLLSLAAAAGLWFCVYRSEELYQAVYLQNDYIGNITEQENFIASGFVYPFLHSVSQRTDQPPEGYDLTEAEVVLARFRDEDIPRDRRVNILVLQMESLTDLEAMGFPGIAPGTYEVLHRLQAESYSGTLVANVIGGGTIRTERCVLTGGLDMPTVDRDSGSYVRYFNDQGYFTTGSHPNRQDFYNRVNVARYLGFTEYLFLEDHYGELTGGKWNCDAVFLPEVFRLFRQHAAAGEQVFSFNVSLQGHGPYRRDDVNRGGSYWQGEGASPEMQEQVNAYLSLMAETQDLLWEQLESLRTDPIPAVVLIYGDHNPSFGSMSEYESCGVSFALNWEDGFIRYYGTPYMIWANDAAKELLGSSFTGEGPTVSPGYLMNLLFDRLGWPGSAYLQYVGSTMERLPLASTNGAYLFDGGFFNSLPPEGEALLQEFRSVQYYQHKLSAEAR